MKTTIKISMMDILQAVKGFTAFSWQGLAERQNATTESLFDFLRAIQLVEAELNDLSNKVIDEIETRTEV
jgi:hypothetical protein